MMYIKKKFELIILIALLGFSVCTFAKKKEPEPYTPPEGMIRGAQFIDRFLPMPIQKGLETELWGAPVVIPRDVHNGIEDPDWSYWGGNSILGEDGKYHFFVCRWSENSPEGHAGWRHSETAYAVADNPTGPYVFKSVLGPGFNPEIFQVKNGSYVVATFLDIPMAFFSDSLTGPWKKSVLPMEWRGMKKTRLSNLTFATRPDGSTLMISRGGIVFISKDGISPYHRVTEESLYPAPKFEDPVVWRSNNQYHLVVNNWPNKRAYYMRSLDGIHWKQDPGLAYDPGLAVFEDGTKVGWDKFERPKVILDRDKRATHMYFAVVDVVKQEDLCNDNHSSKNIVIPMEVERFIRIVDPEDLFKKKTIQIEIQAEPDFDPLSEIDIKSVRFGASEEVDFGRGCAVINHKASGKNMLITFNADGHGFTKDNFVGKLLGQTKAGALLYGFASLPGKTEEAPALFTRVPSVDIEKEKISVIVDNFGLKSSAVSVVEVFLKKGTDLVSLGTASVAALAPYEHREVSIEYTSGMLKKGKKYDFEVSVNGDDSASR